MIKNEEPSDFCDLYWPLLFSLTFAVRGQLCHLLITFLCVFILTLLSDYFFQQALVLTL